MSAQALPRYASDDEEYTPAWDSTVHMPRSDSRKSSASEAFDLERLPVWFSDVARETLDFQRLQANWDTYGGVPADATTLKFALLLLASVSSPQSPKPAVVPISSGGVQFEWFRPRGSVEVAIYRPGDAEVDISWADGDDETFEIGSNVSRLRDSVLRLD